MDFMGRRVHSRTPPDPLDATPGAAKMTNLILPRRKFMTGLASFVAAPAIVKAANLMPVRTMPIAADEVVLGHFSEMQELLLPEIRRITSVYEQLPGQYKHLFSK